MDSFWYEWKRKQTGLWHGSACDIDVFVWQWGYQPDNKINEDEKTSARSAKFVVTLQMLGQSGKAETWCGREYEKF